MERKRMSAFPAQANQKLFICNAKRKWSLIRPWLSQAPSGMPMECRQESLTKGSHHKSSRWSRACQGPILSRLNRLFGPASFSELPAEDFQWSGDKAYIHELQWLFFNKALDAFVPQIAGKLCSFFGRFSVNIFNSEFAKPWVFRKIP